MAQSALVDVARGERDVSHGVTARELLELSGDLGLISASSLERWLLDEGLAVENGAPGLLLPTQRARDLVELLDPLD